MPPHSHSRIETSIKCLSMTTTNSVLGARNPATGYSRHVTYLNVQALTMSSNTDDNVPHHHGSRIDISAKWLSLTTTSPRLHTCSSYQRNSCHRFSRSISVMNRIQKNDQLHHYSNPVFLKFSKFLILIFICTVLSDPQWWIPISRSQTLWNMTFGQRGTKFCFIQKPRFHIEYWLR